MKYYFYCLLLCLCACAQQKNTIKIKGSDTEVNLAVQFAESFHAQNEEILISISGGGSGLGIASLLNGNAHIANSSRSIKSKELMLFKQAGIALDSFIFAQDAVAFIVAQDFPIDSISTIDLSKVLDGTYINWNKLTPLNRPINIYGRQSNSGTFDYVKKKLGIEFSPYAKQMNGNAQILEAISKDNSGIGYVGAGYVIHGGNANIKILRICTHLLSPAISPLDAKSILAGEYFFQRPLYQYFKASDYAKVKLFIDFEKSNKGKEIIQAAGYYPLNP